MELQQRILDYIARPFPLWENEITKLLVQSEWDSLLEKGITPRSYTTAVCHSLDLLSTDVPKFLIEEASDADRSIYLEYPSFTALEEFYNDTGLEPLDYPKEETKELIVKLTSALQIFDSVPFVKEDISLLVKRIQILEQVDEEIDTSYSHPDIPFSIFVSLCKEDTAINSLRVAESILHETMHLKLTLIEKQIDLIAPGTVETFYSPWRDEQRPVRGVLHGLFVFRAIYDLYSSLEKLSEPTVTKYLSDRKQDIQEEFLKCREFGNSSGLTPEAAILINNLLPLS